MKDRSHDDAMAELFREDRGFATEYLNSVLEEREQSDLLIALRQMTKPFGGVPAVAERAKLNPIATLPHPVGGRQPRAA